MRDEDQEKGGMEEFPFPEANCSRDYKPKKTAPPKKETRLALFVSVCGEPESWRPYVLRILPKVLRKELEPEDVIQEACLCALRCNLKSCGESKAQVHDWFKGLIFYTVRNLYRFRVRTKRFSSAIFYHAGLALLEDFSEQGELALLSKEPSHEELLAMHEEIEMVLKAVGELPPVAALLILYVCVEDLSLQEAAKKLGLNPEDASRLLYLAKKTLRKRLLEKRSESNGNGYSHSSGNPTYSP